MSDILFTKEKWSIITVTKNWIWAWNSAIHHACEGNWMVELSVTNVLTFPVSETSTSCPRCGENVPEEIIGLWKLHNMDLVEKYLTKLAETTAPEDSSKPWW